MPGGGLLMVALVFYAVLRYVRRGAASP